MPYQSLQLMYTVKFKTAAGGGLAVGLQLCTLPFTQARRDKRQLKKKALLLHWQMQSAVHFFPTETVDETAKGSGSVGV